MGFRGHVWQTTVFPSGKGFGVLVSDFVNSQNGTNGILTGRMNSDTTSLTDLTNQINDTNSRLSDVSHERLDADLACLDRLHRYDIHQQHLRDPLSSEMLITCESLNELSPEHSRGSRARCD